jgi:CheY-like chemotaxis protein
LAELRAYKIVDTPPEPAFDQIAHFAAKLFDTPMSMIIPRGTERILVVEDEPAVRAAVVQQLTSLGYTVAEAANGSAGLELLGSRQTYDLLLTDVVMPGPVNGKALAEKAIKLSPNLRVLFMSGYSGDAISTLGSLNPGTILLSKPFRKADLAQAIRNALASPESRQADG